MKFKKWKRKRKERIQTNQQSIS